MSDGLFQNYGAITVEDAALLEACLKEPISRIYKENTGYWPDGRPAGSLLTQPLRVCEIGMHDGGTARGIERFVNRWAVTLEYFGIDVDDGSTRPRYVPTGGKVIIGESAEVFEQVPGELDLLWIDGSHTFNHVVIETLHYTPKVRRGGFVCYHDTNPRGQFRSDMGHQYNGPENSPWFALAVNKGLETIGFPERFGFEFFGEAVPSDPNRLDCGTRAFRKL